MLHGHVVQGHVFGFDDDAFHATICFLDIIHLHPERFGGGAAIAVINRDGDVIDVGVAARLRVFEIRGLFEAQLAGMGVDFKESGVAAAGDRIGQRVAIRVGGVDIDHSGAVLVDMQDAVAGQVVKNRGHIGRGLRGGCAEVAVFDAMRVGGGDHFQRHAGRRGVPHKGEEVVARARRVIAAAFDFGEVIGLAVRALQGEDLLDEKARMGVGPAIAVMHPAVLMGIGGAVVVVAAQCPVIVIGGQRQRGGARHGEAVAPVQVPVARAQQICLGKGGPVAIPEIALIRHSVPSILHVARFIRWATTLVKATRHLCAARCGPIKSVICCDGALTEGRFRRFSAFPQSSLFKRLFYPNRTYDMSALTTHTFVSLPHISRISCDSVKRVNGLLKRFRGEKFAAKRKSRLNFGTIWALFLYRKKCPEIGSAQEVSYHNLDYLRGRYPATSRTKMRPSLPQGPPQGPPQG